MLQTRISLLGLAWLVLLCSGASAQSVSLNTTVSAGRRLLTTTDAGSADVSVTLSLAGIVTSIDVAGYRRDRWEWTVNAENLLNRSGSSDPRVFYDTL